MAAKDFWIDQDDPPYPQIRHRSHPSFEPDYGEVYTYDGARREIRNICREHRNHWLAVRHRQLEQTAEQIIDDAIAAGRAE